MDLFQNMIQNLKDDKFLRSESFITLDELAHFWKFKKEEFDIKLEKYRLHISDLLGHSCYIDWNYTNEMNAGIRFCWYSLFSLTSHALVINCHNFKFENVSSSYDDFLKKLFQNDNETKEFIEWFRNWTDKYNVWNHMSHHFFNIYFNYYYNKFEYVVSYFNTLNYNIEDIFNLKSKEIPYFSFYYYHDVTNELKTIKVDENYTHLIDDGIINKISGCFGIKLEQFSKELREEIQLYVKIKQIHYDKDALMQIYSRLEQIKQIKFLYTKMKDLLNDSFTCNLNVLNFEKLKLNNINQVIFRQSLFGGSEFDDVFKNNIILRMLDLSQVKLNYINIHGMDFSGTNIHINPQVIYRKDMSFVNASGLKFSPWDDSFEGVNLRGTIITDYEANIHKENVKSIKLFQPLVNIGKNITVNKDYYYHYKKDINQIIKIYEILGKLVDIFNNGFFNKRIVLKQINQIIFKNMDYLTRMDILNLKISLKIMMFYV